MNLLDYLDKVGERRLERYRLQPHRPIDWKSFIGLAFLAGYYFMVLRLTAKLVPAENAPLVRDAMLVLGPAVGAVVQSLFRSDVKDEISASNTGEAFRAQRAVAEATKAAAESLPPGNGNAAGAAADAVADAASDKAQEIKGE